MLGLVVRHVALGVVASVGAVVIIGGYFAERLYDKLTGSKGDG